MNEKHPSFDWSLTSWEGSRREQLRRWSQLSMDEIFAAQEEMAALAQELGASSTATIREDARNRQSGNAT